MMTPPSMARAAAFCLLLAAFAPAGQAAKVRSYEPTIPKACPAQLQNPLLRPIHHVCPPPVTDIKRIRPYRNPPSYPWTHPVRCLKTTSNSSSPASGREHKYCLYTDATYGGLHGTSIITTAETAVDAVGADAFEDRPYYGGSRKRVYRPGPIVKPGQGGGAGVPSYAVEPTPGKGLGVVAKRKIAQGEIVMLDFPALLMSKIFLEEAVPLQRRRLIRRALGQLPRATQDKVFALARSTGGDELDDILGTNTISQMLGQQEMHIALYPELARINHACNPNAYYRFSPRTLSIEVISYRDIQPNEEITISYAQLTESRTARREFLHQNWHFHCGCSLCRADDPDAVTASEDRRRDMRTLQSTLVRASHSGDYDLALQTAEDLLRTTDAEGVTPVRAEMYDILASIHLNRMDFGNARRLGRMALDSWERLDSVDDAQLQSARWFLRLVEDARTAVLAERAQDAEDEAAMEADVEGFF